MGGDTTTSKEEGPGIPDPARKNETPEIVLDDDAAADSSALDDTPEVTDVPPKPELSGTELPPK